MTSVLTLCAALMFAGSTMAQDAAPRPNILFCIADDWSFPHAGVYGDKVVRTPTFDRIASEGALFTNAYCASPSCTPSRGAILTGQAIHRLAEGANLWSSLPARFAVYPDLLEKAGYAVGYTGKGWGPGQLEPGGWSRNPAGARHKDFASFLASVRPGQPFCFWFGSHEPHRPYKLGSGRAGGMDPKAVTVPPFLPDLPEVRSDICDYYAEVQQFDQQVGRLLEQLEKTDRLDNTLIVMTSDNGMPFPRAKANLYDAGTRMPLAMRWPARVQAGRRVESFVSFTDFAPTFLEAAGLDVRSDMTGKSTLSLLTGGASDGRDAVFLERERHAYVRAGALSYPCRAIRTAQFLYIRNFRPDRWPAGDPLLPDNGWQFGDIDGSPTKALFLENKDDRQLGPFFERACAKRPAEELYDLSKDPAELVNVAGRPEYADARKALRDRLERWMKQTDDPRAVVDDDRFDRYPYYGREGPKATHPQKPKAGE